MEKGEEAPGLYTLTVPTGGGKTISSMAFAMKQAVKYHKRRIIYVIPYVSIIEQTAEIFKDFWERLMCWRATAMWTMTIWKSPWQGG